MSGDGLMQLYPPWRNAVHAAIAGEHEPGTVWTFEQLYGWFGVTMPGPDTVRRDCEKLELAFLGQFKKFEASLLEEHQIALQNVVGVGYRVVDPKEQSRWGYQEFHRELRRGFRKGLRRIANTNLANLTMAERQVNADYLAKMSAIRHMLSKRGIASTEARQLGTGDAG